jgi:eukaryotic-like serine/threonine-protein kinase
VSLVGRLAVLAAIAVSAALAGCGGRAPAPSGPSAQVRAEVEQAETAEQARRHDEARTHYERAVAAARDPDSVAFARREYAETLITWGEYPEAIAQLEGAVAVRPSASAWHDLGLLRNNRGDVPGALAALEQARALAPRDARPRVALAALRWRSGDRAGAAAEYRALLELPLPERLRAKVQWALGELAKP